MSTYGEQQDRTAPFVLDEVEYDPQIVRHTAGKRFVQSPLQLVRLQAGMKRILCQKPKGNLEIITDARASLDEVLGVSLESSGVDERITHSAILLASSLGVTIWESPEEYCFRASSTAAISSDLRAADTRRRTISSRVSCSSWDSRSTASITSANVTVASLRHDPSSRRVSGVSSRVAPRLLPSLAGEVPSPDGVVREFKNRVTGRARVGRRSRVR